jgi:hypothetical protein
MRVDGDPNEFGTGYREGLRLLHRGGDIRRYPYWSWIGRRWDDGRRSRHLPTFTGTDGRRVISAIATYYKYNDVPLRKRRT